MSHRIGQRVTGASQGTPSAVWLLVGGVVGVGGYFIAKELFKKPTVSPPTSDQVMPLPPVAPPSRYADFASVDARFAQVRDLYHMGPAHMTAAQALAEIDGLEAAANKFATQGQVTKAQADSEIADMEDFKKQVQDAVAFIASQQGTPPVDTNQTSPIALQGSHTPWTSQFGVRRIVW